MLRLVQAGEDARNLGLNLESMSARANPYHNAWTESFIGTLKAEMLQGGCFLDGSDARTEIFAYIESYYNTQRKHSSLDYLRKRRDKPDWNRE